MIVYPEEIEQIWYQVSPWLIFNKTYNWLSVKCDKGIYIWEQKPICRYYLNSYIGDIKYGTWTRFETMAGNIGRVKHILNYPGKRVVTPMTKEKIIENYDQLLFKIDSDDFRRLTLETKIERIEY